VGYHDDPVNWHWVEQEKGVLAVDLRVAGRHQRVIGYDCLSGCEQELKTETDGDGTLVCGVLVRDYPLLVRFTAARWAS
jgi:hypothetical protein